MPHYNPPYRSATPPGYPYGNLYPGVSPYELSQQVGSSALVPYSPDNAVTPLAAAAPAASTAKSALSIPNLNEIKGIVDRMGGIEGIMGTVGKVQKVMQGIQQFAPMAKVLLGFGKGRTNSASKGKEIEYRPPRKRKKNKKRKSSSTRHPKKLSTKKNIKSKKRK